MVCVYLYINVHYNKVFHIRRFVQLIVFLLYVANIIPGRPEIAEDDRFFPRIDKFEVSINITSVVLLFYKK